MASQALEDLNLGLDEVSALRDHPPRNSSKTAAERHRLDAAAVAHRRACTVLLCSHLERYLYNINEQAIDYLTGALSDGGRIPVKIRLLQSKAVIDEINKKQWDRRDVLLAEFARSSASLWGLGGPPHGVDPAHNLVWMKAPRTADIRRFFRQYEIDDVFKAVTKTPNGLGRLIREIDNLVENRNGIAHGDRTVQPERTELTKYSAAVRDFCVRADAVMARRLAEISGMDRPW